MQATVQSYKTIDPGQYDAAFKSVDERDGHNRDGQPSTYWLWTFDVDTDGQTVTTTGTSSAKLSTKTKAYAWVSALLRRRPNPDETINFDELVGLKCRLILGLDDKEEFNIIEKVLPAGQSDSRELEEELIAPF